MGRRLRPSRGSPGRSSPWQAALLAASILSSGFLLTQGLDIEVTVKPSQTLLQGWDATLTPGGIADFFVCGWFRGAQAEASRILTYVPPPSDKQQNGPGFTGRETAGPGCSLHIQNVTLSDNGTYIVSKTLMDGSPETGHVQIEVIENLTKPGVSAFPSPFPIEFTGSVNLTCETSSKKATISWLYNDKPLGSSPQIQVSEVNCTVTISSAIRNHTGFYQCEVSNVFSTNKSDSIYIAVICSERVSNVTIIGHPEKAIENQPTVLSCSSAGFNVSYRWSKGNQPLESGGHISLSNSSLTFSPTYRNDSGDYTCYGYNSFSDSSTIFPLDVFYGPDEQVISPPRHDYANGSLLTLSCQADSHPPAQYTWYFKETELVKDPNLSISSLSFDQAGNYTCEASNHETKLSRSLSWEINVLEEVSNVTIQGPSETTENGSVTLSCISNGSKVSYTWFRENQRLEHGGHISLLGPSHEKLTLNPVSRSDAGSYTCRGDNSVSSDISNSFPLDVLYGPDDPIISPPEHNYTEGSNLNLFCRADSNPVPQYTWLFNETEEVGNSSQHLISDLSFEKAGNYICRATNHKTNTSRAAAHEIRVLEKLSPPVLWPTESVVKEHTNITLSCTISASSTVTVSWFKDGKPVPAKAVISEQNRILLVPDIGKDDEGMYTCVASNWANNATSNPSRIILESRPPSSLGVGAIVGIVLGSLAVAALAGTLLFCFLRARSPKDTLSKEMNPTSLVYENTRPSAKVVPENSSDVNRTYEELQHGRQSVYDQLKW